MTLFKYIVGLSVVAFASVAQAQNAVPDNRTRVPNEPFTKTGVTWANPAALDSLPPWCIAPPKVVSAKVPKRVAAKPKAVKTANVGPVAPPKRAVRKKPAAKPAVQILENSPRMMCPQYVTGPRMYGSVIPVGSVVPLFSTPAAPDPMEFIDVAEAADPVINPVEVDRRRFPAGWLWGGGLVGAGFFTSFLNGGDNPDKPGNPLGPENPTPIGPPGPPPPPPVTPTPEPGTLVLLGTGLAALGGMMRRRGKGENKK